MIYQALLWVRNTFNPQRTPGTEHAKIQDFKSISQANCYDIIFETISIKPRANISRDKLLSVKNYYSLIFRPRDAISLIL